MPKKINPYRSHGEKVVSLFARLLFSGETYSLTQLARLLQCSKPTVLRLVEDIRMAYQVDIEETIISKKKYYRLKRPHHHQLPLLTISEMEMQVLQMCRAFAENLLGQEQFEAATRGLLKSRALLPSCDPAEGPLASDHFSIFKSGRIDYSLHQDTLRTLIRAMDEKKVCRVAYQRIGADTAKTADIIPLKIFTHNNALYLHARYHISERTPGRPSASAAAPAAAPATAPTAVPAAASTAVPTPAVPSSAAVADPAASNGRISGPVPAAAPAYDPLFVIHRFKQVQMTERAFEFPANYDFEKIFNNAFGIMDGALFTVEIEFTGLPAKYVQERIWSKDQQILDMGGGVTRLIFTASSRLEMIPWVLAFAETARVIRPDWLVLGVQEAAHKILSLYRPAGQPAGE